MKLLLSNGALKRFDSFAEELGQQDQSDIKLRKIILAKSKSELSIKEYINKLNLFLADFPNEDEIWIELGLQYEKILQ